MKLIINIELFEEFPLVNIYSFSIGDEVTEFEKFLKTYHSMPDYKRDIQKIVYWIDKIASGGALERYFRPEGKMRDNLCAIPIEFSRLRLYALRISDSILIVGNGGIKDKKTYDEIPELKYFTEILVEIDRNLRNLIKRNLTYIEGNNLSGKLSFEIEIK